MPDSINFIRMSTIDFLEDKPKSKLRSTGSTMFHRAVSRQTKPAWGNRIVKDFYDLDYNVPSSSFRIDQKFKNTTKNQHNRVRADLQRSKLNRRKAALPQPSHSEILSDRQRSIPLRRKRGVRHIPQSIEVGALNGASSKVQGLSPFEFAKTIQGRMEARLSLHISFDKNNSSRIINQNPIFYNRHQDLDFTHSKIMQSRRTMAAFHPFSSYSQRRVFEPKPELDKMFDTDSGRKAVYPKSLKEAVIQFERVLARKQQRMKESAILAYQTLPVALSLKKKPVSYSVSRSERQTYFSPQVISQKRGCFR